VRAMNATVLIAGLLAAAAVPSRAQEPPTPSGEAAPAPPSGYTIGAADVLQVGVWKEPDLSTEVTVRFDGMITVPLVGEVEAAGRTPTQLADDLARALGRYIELPRVTVGVLQANSARFYVLGMVGKSGEFNMTGRTTLLQAIALAGGFKEFAKTAEIVIVRRDQKVVPVNYKRIADGSDVSQNIILAPGDTVVVP